MLWIAIFCEEMAEVFLDMVSKSFGNNVAVKDLSLTVPNKKCVVLLGPTGAGKTTTLRLIAGLEKPQEGKVFIDGEDVTLRTPAQRDVAFRVPAIFFISSLFRLRQSCISFAGTEQTDE